MKKARNLWRDLPQGGSRYGSVLTRLFLLLCLLATTQAGWAASKTVTINRWYLDGSTIHNMNTTTCRLIDEITLTSTGTPSLNGTQLNFDKNQGVTIATANGKNISSIKIIFSNPMNSYLSVSPTGTLEWTNSNKTVTWTGSSNSVEFTGSNTSTYKITSVEVTYEEDDIPFSSVTNVTLNSFKRLYSSSNNAIFSATKSSQTVYGVGIANGIDSSIKLGKGKAFTLYSPRPIKSAVLSWKSTPENFSLSADVGYINNATWTSSGNTTTAITFTNNGTVSSDVLNSIAIEFVTDDTPATIAAPTFTFGGSVQAANSTISSGVHTGDVVRIDAESGKYIYADWSSSTSQAKTYVFDSGKTAKNQNYYEAVITSGGTRVIYAVAGVNNDGTGASSDLTYIQFTGVTPQNPTFSVAEGSVAKNSTLELTAGYNQDKIYYTYTTDGSEPADPTTSSTLYSSALNIFTADNTTYKIKAVAYDKDGNNPSSVILKTYTTSAASTSGTATFDYSASGANASSWTQAPITVATNATGIDSNGYLKSWGSGDLTITLSGANITKVVVHYENANRKPTAITASDGTALSNESTTDTWDNAEGSTNLMLTLTGSPRVTGIDVTYGESVATYDIHYNTVSNGELSGAAKAAAGARVTVTATPATNYGLSSLTIYKTDDSDVTSECNVSGNQFTMPAYAVKVGGTFALLPTITKNFESTQGNVSTSPDTHAAPGMTVTIDADAASGYSVGTITVKDADDNNITVTDNQFTMPNSNVTVTVTFNAAAVSEGDKWNFATMTEADDAKYKADNTKWNTTDNSSYYYSKFSTSAKNEQTDVISTTIQQIKDLKFVRTDGGALSAGKVRIYLPTSTDAGYLNFNTSNGGIVLPNMAAGTLITVDFNGGGSSYGILPTNATTVDGAEITSVIKSATRTTTTFKVKTAGEVIITGNNSKVKFYKITVGETVDVAEPSFDKADGSGYDGTGNLSVTVTTNETGEGTKTTYWKYATTALDRDAIVAADNGFTTKTATAEITATNVNQQAIVLSAVTKYDTGDNIYYSDVVTATYPYTGKYTPSMTGSTIQIQQGDRHTIEPEITLPDGSKFNPEEDTQNEGKSSIHDYFDFTYQMTAKTGTATQYITLDGESATGQAPTTGGVVNTKIDDNRAEVGDRATIHIVATKKSDFPADTWPFASDQCTTDVTIEVIKKVQGAMMKFYWDPEFKKQVSTTEGEEWTMQGTLTVFKGEFSNGRMFYVKPEPGYKVYVAAGVSDSPLTASKVDGISKSGTVYKYPYRKNDPTDEYPDAPIEYNGIPLLVDDFGGASTKTYYIALVTYNSEGKPEGSAVNAKFTIKNDESKRPGDVTFNPSENNAKRNTAQTVLTQGVNEAYVYGKFSGTKTSYNTHTLIQEPGINGGQTNVGVFSTEVDKRKISALQIAKNTDGFYYMGTQKTNTYEYLFASEISLKSNTYTTNVWDGEKTRETVDVKTLIDKITYYNKDSKKDINIADSIQAHSGETAPVDTKEIDRVTYSIQYFNGAGGTGVTDGTTLDGSVVTIGKHSGYVVVTATYPGGYKKKVNSRENVTDVSKATYTIYLVNPDEQIPTITPGSRNFIDEQSFIIQAPDRWNALYMVVEKDKEEDQANYNAEIATYSSDDTKVKMLEAGEYIRLTVTKTSKVRAFAYDPSVTEHNVPGQANTTSKEVTATYTKLDPLKAPTLSPYGTSEEPHIRTAKSLTVIATTNDPYSGLEVYYTLDGSDPTPTTGEKYNGSEKINISGASTTIKAITYRPETGQISPVTTGVYMYTGSIKQPKFKVNGNYYTSGTITVSPTDEITIESEDGGDIYYTLDGATPTTADAVPFTTGFKIVKNTTGKAIAVKDDASSPITTVEFELATEKNDLWEAVEETTPGGKLAANDRYVAVGNSGNSSTKAVKYLTATFGGMDAAGWNKTSIGEKTQGTPLDGVGKYSISTTRDVWDETDAEVKNTASTVHGKTFALPAKGNFVRFEPERDGDLTIWLLQQGGLHYTDDGDLCNQFIRLRPVYMFDEKGTSITATDIKSSTRLSDNWNDLDVSDTQNAQGRFGNWVAINKSQNGVVNKYYTEDQSEKIYNMYKSHLTIGGNDISSGDPIEPFAITDEIVKGYTGIDGTGYVMPSGGNVKYTFHVEGGKSYYFFGFRTKLAIRGFQFKPSSETVAKSVTVADNTADIVATIKAGETGGTIAKDEICNVTYSRKFAKDTWAAVTFPFSVSVAQMKKVFGDKVDLIHFDNVSGSKINFKRHWYPMIVAGTPVFIKPSKDMGTSVTFEGVRIEAETVNAVSGEGGYKMTGSFTPDKINEGDYYISGGKLAVRKGNSIDTKACRSWLTADSNNGARFDLTTGTADAFAEEAWSVIGNPQPFVASDETIATYINGVQEDGIINNIFEGPTGIYTINGQLIRKDATSLEGLSKGIYIVNGKKIAVK